jgi:hypothetical protein
MRWKTLSGTLAKMEPEVLKCLCSGARTRHVVKWCNHCCVRRVFVYVQILYLNCKNYCDFYFRIWTSNITNLRTSNCVFFVCTHLVNSSFVTSSVHTFSSMPIPFTCHLWRLENTFEGEFREISHKYTRIPLTMKSRWKMAFLYV